MPLPDTTSPFFTFSASSCATRASSSAKLCAHAPDEIAKRPKAAQLISSALFFIRINSSPHSEPEMDRNPENWERCQTHG